MTSSSPTGARSDRAVSQKTNGAFSVRFVGARTIHPRERPLSGSGSTRGRGRRAPLSPRDPATPSLPTDRSRLRRPGPASLPKTTGRPLLSYAGSALLMAAPRKREPALAHPQKESRKPGLLNAPNHLRPRIVLSVPQKPPSSKPGLRSSSQEPITRRRSPPARPQP